MSAISGRFRPFHSLIGRFIFASLVLLPIFISLSGTLLVNSFAHSQLRAEQETLQAHLYLLLSLTEVEDQSILLPEALTEPRFNQPDSGLYGFIYDRSGQELWRSGSALLIQTDIYDQKEPFEMGNRSFNQRSDKKLTLNLLNHDIEWVNTDESTTPLRFIIASDNSPLTVELASYQTRLWQWLGAMGLALIGGQMVIMRWGLQPLKRLSRQLNELQSNKIQQLDNNYPKEIQPVTENFNTILHYEKKQRERYRNTMSDLAHSLKTPLAVIQSQLDEDQQPTQAISEQLDRINQIISHQLKRAVIKVNHNAITTHTDKISVQVMANRLINILDKVYKDKRILFTNLIKADSYFYGDEADLLEVMGNLLDNACKYGEGEVCITSTTNVYEDHCELVLSISDNGQGIPDTDQKNLLVRGARGDTAQAGQGLGLSVAVDIISSYGGGISVSNNNGQPHLSGACFRVVFPQTNNMA